MTTAPVGYAPVPLPSRGLFYGGLLPEGVAYIRKLKVSEEAAIQSSASGVDLVNAVVSAAVKLPAGLNHADLLVTDRMALLIALRSFTFGPRYQYNYRCRSCGADNKATADLSKELSENKAKDGVTEPMLVDLPDAGVQVGLRFMRGRDEVAITKSLKRAGMTGSSENPLVLRLCALIATVDGKEMDSHTKESFVRDLTMLDSAAIQDTIDENESGIDLTIHTDCKACGADNDVLLPFGAEFFRPTRDKS